VSWAAVVPVKAWRSAKSRLDLDLREEIARALTLDTLDVLTSHPDIAHVVVVTVDAEVGDEARLRGATVLAEERGGLNGAIRQACAWIASNRADPPTVVVPADLAYLSSGVLAEALEALAANVPAHIPDLSGEGTTLLAARSASAVDPHYGINSSDLHTAAGFARLESVDPKARADIDYLDDLARDAAWVPGRRVAAILARSARAVG
jgi:2-phospho-L-lactate guanylyltransferase